MKKGFNYYVGKFLLLSAYGSLLGILYMNAEIAASVNPDNMFGFNYEPSGIQLLYFVFVLPILFALSVVIALIQKKLTKQSLKPALLPTVMGLSFFLLLVLDYSLRSLTGGTRFFYFSAFVLEAIFLPITIGLIIKENSEINRLLWRKR